MAPIWRNFPHAMCAHLSACSMMMAVASGMSTPTSTTTVQMSTGVAPVLKPSMAAALAAVVILPVRRACL